MLIRRRKQTSADQLDVFGVSGANGKHDASPFLAARREFASAFGDLAKGKRNWQVVAFSLLALLAILLLADIRLATSSRVVPYIVEVDKLGQVAAIAPAAEMQTPEPRLIASQLADFIRNARTVLPSAAAIAEGELLDRAYAFTTPETAGFLNSYFSNAKNDPRMLGTRLVRQVTVTSVLQVPKSPAWRLRWTERDIPSQVGVLARTTAWEGYVTITLIPPTTAEIVRVNPLGIYLTAINWTQVAETEGGPP